MRLGWRRQLHLAAPQTRQRRRRAKDGLRVVVRVVARRARVIEVRVCPQRRHHLLQHELAHDALAVTRQPQLQVRRWCQPLHLPAAAAADHPRQHTCCTHHKPRRVAQRLGYGGAQPRQGARQERAVQVRL